MLDAIRIKENDNVGTAVAALKAGQTASYITEDGEIITIIIKEDIPVFHKFALADIQPYAPVVKYGEHIGFAKNYIAKGQYVHIHNVYSKRGKTDAKRSK